MIQVFVQGWSWNNLSMDNQFWKVSFLNKTVTPVPFTSRTDLFPYLVEDGLGTISFTAEDVEQDIKGYYKSMYSSNVQLRFNGNKLINGQTLKDFFLIDQNTSYIKYKVEIIYNGTTLFVGSISQDGLSQVVDTSAESGTITATVLGFDKEAKDYYSNIPLRPMSFIPGASPSLTYRVEFEQEGEINIANHSVPIFFSQLFDSNFFISPTDLRSYTGNTWRIIDRPHFLKTPAGKLQWYKSGYSTAVQKGENVFDYFKKVCNAMGWVFYFWTRNGVPALFIKDRKDNSAFNTLYIGNDIILDSGYHLQKTSPNIRPHAVVCLDGQEFGGDFGLSNSAMRGNRVSVLAYNRQRVTITSGIKDVNRIGQGYSATYQHYGTVRENTDDKFSYSIDSAPGGNVLFNYKMNKEDVMILDNGSHNDLGVQVDRFNRKNFAQQEPVNSSSFLFTGHYGHHCYAPVDNSDSNNVNFNDYSQTNFYLDNFKSLLTGALNYSVDVRIKGLLTTPFTNAEFTNGEYPNIKFTIKDVGLDLYRNETELKVYAI